jgi:hypothetical protein
MMYGNLHLPLKVHQIELFLFQSRQIMILILFFFIVRGSVGKFLSLLSGQTSHVLHPDVM